jgi:hypothetical protein
VERHWRENVKRHRDKMEEALAPPARRPRWDPMRNTLTSLGFCCESGAGLLRGLCESHIISFSFTFKNL